MDKSFANYTDAQFYAQTVIEAMRNGNIFAEDLINLENVGGSTQFRVDSKKLIDKLAAIINNPTPGRIDSRQPGLPDFTGICDMSGMTFNFNLNLTIPEHAKLH